MSAAGSFLRALCRERTPLSDDDIAVLERLAASLPVIADLDGTDVFIDCLCADGLSGVVIAEAHPPGGLSMYADSVVGKLVLPGNEPAVFRAFAMGTPVRDTLGITQENRTVRQSVAPFRNASGAIVGVLIQERDVSEDVKRDRRFEKLAVMAAEQKKTLSRFRAGDAVFIPDADALAMKEIHHRVKNNLQLVASMLNLQARNTKHPEVRAAFRENVGRIMSIASVYDVLTTESSPGPEAAKKIFLLPLLKKVCYTIGTCSNSEERRIDVDIQGDDIALDSEKATHIALVVNELVMNAVEHAFVGRESGHVRIVVRRGNTYATIAIDDDGTGIPPDSGRGEGLGMNIVRALVAKLGGNLRIESGDTGSRAAFDFLQ